MDGAARQMRPGPSGAVKVGRLSLILLGGPGAYAIRLRDPESPYRRDFRGIESFPVRPEYRVTARFFPGERTMTLAMSRGEKEDSKCPGYAVFELGGRQMRLYALLENPNARTLWFIFRDQTTGKGLIRPAVSWTPNCRGTARWFSTSTRPTTRLARSPVSHLSAAAEGEPAPGAG